MGRAEVIREIEGRVSFSSSLRMIVLILGRIVVGSGRVGGIVVGRDGRVGRPAVGRVGRCPDKIVSVSGRIVSITESKVVGREGRVGRVGVGSLIVGSLAVGSLTVGSRVSTTDRTEVGIGRVGGVGTTDVDNPIGGKGRMENGRGVKVDKAGRVDGTPTGGMVIGRPAAFPSESELSSDRRSATSSSRAAWFRNLHNVSLLVPVPALVEDLPDGLSQDHRKETRENNGAQHFAKCRLQR